MGVFDKQRLQKKYALSCIENYLLYAWYTDNRPVEPLFYKSVAAFSEIVKGFTDFSNFYAVPRLQDVCLENSFIEYEFRRTQNYESILGSYQYVALSVFPAYVKERFRIQLMRDDHYILVSKAGSHSYEILNDTPLYNGTVSQIELKNAYSGRIFAFCLLQNPSVAEYAKMFSEFTDSFEILMKSNNSINSFQVDVQKLRDIICVLSILRRRMCALCKEIVDINVTTPYLSYFDKLYVKLDYLMKKGCLSDIDVEYELKKVFENDHLLLNHLYECLMKKGNPYE